MKHTSLSSQWHKSDLRDKHEVVLDFHSSHNLIVSSVIKKPFVRLCISLTFSYVFFCSFCRRYGTKCGGCSQGISPQDLVRKARDKVFHLNCFTCMVCRKKLSTGEELYILDDNKFICKDDFMNNKNSQGKKSYQFYCLDAFHPLICLLRFKFFPPPLHPEDVIDSSRVIV